MIRQGEAFDTRDGTWTAVPGTSGSYMLREDGTCARVDRGLPHILRPFLRGRTWYYNIYRQGLSTCVSVLRLLAITYIDPQLRQNELVFPYDGNSDHLTLENVQIVDRSEMQLECPMKYRGKPVEEVDDDGRVVRTFGSVAEASSFHHIQYGQFITIV